MTLELLAGNRRCCVRVGLLVLTGDLAGGACRVLVAACPAGRIGLQGGCRQRVGCADGLGKNRPQDGNDDYVKSSPKYDLAFYITDSALAGAARAGDGVAFLLLARHTGVVTADQLEMISTDPQVMHGQAVIAGTRVPVSVILDCLAAGMTAEEITAEYPTVTVAGVRAAAAYGAALAREELLPLPQSR